MAGPGLNNGYKVGSDVWLYKGLTMDTRWGAMNGWTRAKQWIQGVERCMTGPGFNNGYKVGSNGWLYKGLTMDTRWGAMDGWTRA